MSHAVSTFANSARSSTTLESAFQEFWSTVAILCARTAFSSFITRIECAALSAVNSSSSWKAPSDYPSTSTFFTKWSRKTPFWRVLALTLRMRTRRACRKSSVSSTQSVSSTSTAQTTWTYSAVSASSHSMEMMSASWSTYMRSRGCASFNSRTSWRTKTRPGSATKPSIRQCESEKLDICTLNWERRFEFQRRPASRWDEKKMEEVWKIYFFQEMHAVCDRLSRAQFTYNNSIG